MNAIVVGLSLAAAVSLGWVGRKAAKRIEHWGERMNEVDAIFRSAATEEEMASYSEAPQHANGGTQAGARGRMAVGVPR